MDRTCSKCGCVLKEDDKFCPHCGAVVPEDKATAGQPRFCPHCGAPLEAEAVFCGACGKAVGAATGSTAVQSSGSQPVTAPKAVVPARAGRTQEPKKGLMDQVKDLFLTKGRLGRKQFCIRMCLIFAFGLIPATFSALFSDVSVLGTLAALFLVISLLAIMIAYITISIRRFHDLGKPGWMAILQFLPGIGVVFQLYAMCAKGNAGPNTYGEDPLIH